MCHLSRTIRIGQYALCKSTINVMKGTTASDAVVAPADMLRH